MYKSKIITAISALFLASGAALANDIYIEQVGSGSTVNVLQQGTGNSIGDSTNSAFIGGGSNNVAIDQIGNSNTLSMVVNGAGTNTTVTTTGSGNQQTINCGTTGSAGCSGSTLTQIVTGDDNIVTQNLGAGANHTSSINILGDTNTVTHTSTATGTTSASINVNGNLNAIDVTQSGMATKHVTVNSTGNSNVIGIVQSD